MGEQPDRTEHAAKPDQQDNLPASGNSVPPVVKLATHQRQADPRRWRRISSPIGEEAQPMPCLAV